MTIPDGVWTYRSLSDNPGMTGDFNNVAIWEAELMIETIAGSSEFHGHIGGRPDVVPADHPYLTVTGRSHGGDPRRVTFRGLGVPGTEFDGWIYDYDGYVSPVWLGGVGQVPAITGTVTRTVRHGTAPAGEVFSFYAVRQPFAEPRGITSEVPQLGLARVALPDTIRDMLASERHRLHHQIWHAARNRWARLSDARRDRLRDLGWQPGPKSAERLALGPGMWTNGSGEDFLYMHRRMIAMVQAEFPFSRWGRLPSPGLPSSFRPGFPKDRVGNPDGWAVPEAWELPGAGDFNVTFAWRKTAAAFHSEFQRAEAQFTDPDYLVRVSLGELGARLEWTLHNWMHMRWASVPRNPDTGAPAPEGRAPLDWDPKWLKPENDYLGETFSSHVNPVFWRLHGWVDDRIGQWFAVQEAERPGTVKQKQVHGVDWFEADGTWAQITDPWEGPRGGGDHGGLDLDPDAMKAALTAIYGPEPAPPGAMTAAAEVGAASAFGPRPDWFTLEPPDDAL